MPNTCVTACATRLRTIRSAPQALSHGSGLANIFSVLVLNDICVVLLTALGGPDCLVNIVGREVCLGELPGFWQLDLDLRDSGHFQPAAGDAILGYVPALLLIRAEEMKME